MKIYCLMFPTDCGEVVARGTACAGRRQADTLLSDRIANGESFPDEYVALIRYADYCRQVGQHVPCGLA